MSQKTGTVKSLASDADGSPSSVVIEFPGPPVSEETWMDPPARVWDILVSAKTSGGTVTITYDDSHQPPTRSSVKTP